MSGRRAFAGAALVGVIAWLSVWFQTDERANWDSLIYHKHAFEYAGVPAADADALSWYVYARYADPVPVAVIAEALDGNPWRAPEQDRWMNLYRMRPFYPALVTAAYPLLGLRAPMALSAIVTVSFFVLTFVGFGLLFGLRVGVLATGAAVLNDNFMHWLVILTPEGLAMVLWAAGLIATAGYVQTGRRPWLAGIVIAVALLAITRPTGFLAPLVPLVCMIAAAALRRPVWRRFAVATIAAGIPALGMVAVFTLAGMPTLADVIQENPTRHFALPDIADPMSHLFSQIGWAVPNRLLATFFSQPVLMASVVAGFAGLVVARSWVVAPFLVGAFIAPAAWLIHPVWYDAGRIMAPGWVSLNLGIALLISAFLLGQRERVLAAMDWATRSEATVPE
jgi:hypothetical protein